MYRTLARAAAAAAVLLSSVVLSPVTASADETIRWAWLSGQRFSDGPSESFTSHFSNCVDNGGGIGFCL